MKKFRAVFCAFVALLLCFAFIPQPRAAAFADTDEQRVYVGGYPVGISIDIGGLLVEEIIGVETEYGMAAVDGLQAGDVIRKISGVSVKHADDIPDTLEPEPTKVEILRGGSVQTVEVRPIVEAFSKKARLGVKIKDIIYGVGTVTFVRKDGSFAALGHEIAIDGGNNIPFAGGHIHDCKIMGIKRGAHGEAGALLASLVQERVFGTVTCNNSFGVAGRYERQFDKSELLPLASHGDVRLGKAQIKTCVDGESKYYDIEIIKATPQNTKKEKGLVIRVTDKRLLECTGGVVRGMSGSPIVQDGKLVGAVTHVFLNDFTKGYGIYADFLN